MASGAALTITHPGCVVRHSRIRHAGGAGIKAQFFTGNLTIEAVEVINTGAPASGAATSGETNIACDGITGVVSIKNVTLRNGSQGIYLHQCANAVLSGITGYNQRGPFPGGQLVQINDSAGTLLEDFYAYNASGTAWTEDNISIYNSSNVIVRRGVIDGNNSPSGVGVMVENNSTGVTVTDVDALRMGNGAFSAYSGSNNAVFTTCRVKASLGLDQGRGKPTSRGWNSTTRRNIAPVTRFVSGSTGVQFVSCAYWNIPGKTSYSGPLTETSEAWEDNFTGGSVASVDSWTETNFTERTPWVNVFAWT